MKMLPPWTPFLAKNRDLEAPLPGAVEVGEVDALPASQREPPVPHRQRLRRSDQRGLDVGRGGALRVPVDVLPWHECLERVEDVREGVGVGILIDENARRRVRHRDLAEAAFHAAFADHLLHPVRDLDRVRPLARLDRHDVSSCGVRHARHRNNASGSLPSWRPAPDNGPTCHATCRSATDPCWLRSIGTTSCATSITRALGRRTTPAANRAASGSGWMDDSPGLMTPPGPATSSTWRTRWSPTSRFDTPIFWSA